MNAEGNNPSEDPQAGRRRAVEAFRLRWSEAPALVVRAPGRVNLIGEHTDYNEGFVLPMAIGRAVWIALTPRPDDRVVVHAADFQSEAEIELDQLGKGGPPWSEFVRGVAWAMGAAGHRLAGWQGVVCGDVPIGAGLSSSAALEVAAARAFAAVSGIAWDRLEMARIAQRAENEWVGVPCGIMDQIASTAGVAGHALLIDCRSLEVLPVPLPAGVSVVVLDTGTRREVGASAYEERRRACRQAADALGAAALRDVSLQDLARAASRLPESTLRRARHIVTENERTLQAAHALRRGDAMELGQLMNASHASMRDDFEISTPELDEIVACSRRGGCLGARLTGAGFGGCAVALVWRNELADFAGHVAGAYAAATGREARIYVCQAAGGAEVVEDSR